MIAQKLQWPTGWKRTTVRQFSRFGTRHHDTKRRTTLSGALEFLQAELDRLGAKEAVLSTNLETRIDGMPRGQQAQPADPGAAVYFLLKGHKRVLACDSWDQVQCNILAIAKHIEALRGMERWGVGSIEQAFTGYAALPAPGQGTGSRAWEILGIPAGSDEQAVRLAFKGKAMAAHPDRGGSPDAWHTLNEAFTDALNQTKAGS
jgi:hypothetical protein